MLSEDVQTWLAAIAADAPGGAAGATTAAAVLAAVLLVRPARRLVFDAAETVIASVMLAVLILFVLGLPFGEARARADPLPSPIVAVAQMQGRLQGLSQPSTVAMPCAVRHHIHAGAAYITFKGAQFVWQSLGAGGAALLAGVSA